MVMDGTALAGKIASMVLDLYQSTLATTALRTPMEAGRDDEVIDTELTQDAGHPMGSRDIPVGKQGRQGCRHSVFLDDLSLSGDDPDHSVHEDRQVVFGLSTVGRLLVVAYTERGEQIRLISARQATRSERKLYEEG